MWDSYPSKNMECEFPKSNILFVFASQGIPITVQQPLYLFLSTPLPPLEARSKGQFCVYM